MSELQEWLFEPSFNRSVKVRACDERITSDSGLLLLREADHRLGITEHLAGQLDDPRRQDLIRYELVELLRECVYALAMGYAAQDDAAHTDRSRRVRRNPCPGQGQQHESAQGGSHDPRVPRRPVRGLTRLVRTHLQGARPWRGPDTRRRSPCPACPAPSPSPPPP